MLRTAVASQVWLSRKLDSLLPEKYRVDGNMDFRRNFAPRYLRPGATIYDIGSGRHPFLSPEQKRDLGARVMGLDIDPAELASAPPGAYDGSVCADVTQFRGRSDADLVICQSLMEHVNGTDCAFVAIASALKPGGVAVLFVPSRHAVFARLNLLLPQRVKLWLLHTIYPHTKVGYGFVSYYDRCTPADFTRMAAAAGMEVIELRCYYKSSYFMAFAPLHVLWRAWLAIFSALRGEQAAETFSMALRKAHEPTPNDCRTA